jgi:uncharacterized protein YcgI (DUF1989 family)
MTQSIVQNIVVPRCSGKALRVDKGQILRVIAHEGKQVVDLTFLNADNYKEHFAAEHSSVLNSLQGLGGYYRLTHLYSKPPYENVMATVLDDVVGSGGRGGERAGHFMMCHCSKRLLNNLGFPGTRTCSDNFADAFREIGLRQEDTYDETIFNVWMNSWVGEDGGMYSAPPLVEEGDHIDFRAEMNLMAMISVCPDETSPCNDFKAKSLKFQVLESEA